MLGKQYVYSTKYRDLYHKGTGEVLGYYPKGSSQPVICRPVWVDMLFQNYDPLDIVELEDF